MGNGGDGGEDGGSRGAGGDSGDWGGDGGDWGCGSCGGCDGGDDGTAAVASGIKRSRTAVRTFRSDVSALCPLAAVRLDSPHCDWPADDSMRVALRSPRGWRMN